MNPGGIIESDQGTQAPYYRLPAAELTRIP
jgi:hypothetical protein